MANKRTKYKLLIHCRIPQIREGFEVYLDSIFLSIETLYADLSLDGIMSKLKFQPHLIVVLLSESDADMLLLFKIKMFSGKIPTLLITPTIPQKYELLLKSIGIEKIIQLPEYKETICATIRQMLKDTNGIP